MCSCLLSLGPLLSSVPVQVVIQSPQCLQVGVRIRLPVPAVRFWLAFIIISHFRTKWWTY